MYLGDVDTVAVNLAGLPAISVPCGVDEESLPIGLQLVGNAFCEEMLFDIAEGYEQLRGIFPTAWEQSMGRPMREKNGTEIRNVESGKRSVSDGKAGNH